MCLFATFLADSLRHSSIKVYLSAVRSLHVDQGLSDPLENCLRFQRVVRGIKRSQGSLPANPRLPISSNILRIVHSALDPNSFDDHMIGAACLLAYFGFLRSAEFTVPSLSAFDPGRHLSVRDIAVDVPLNPSCLQICIKASKTDPFRKGCNILVEPGSPPLFAVQAVVSFLERRGNRPGPCSFARMAFLCLALYSQTDKELFFYMLVCLVIFQVTVFELGQSLLLQGLYSGSPHPSFGPLEKRCLQTIYSNSSRPHNSRCQINGGLLW